MVDNQIYLFIIFILTGILIAIIFDFFRILRRVFNTNDFATYIEDICFWIITGLIILYVMYIFCYGELRFFMLLGILMGVTIYMITISKYVILVLVKVLSLAKKIVFFPFKLTNRIIFRPLFCICSKIKNIIIRIFDKICSKMKKIIKKGGIFIKKENNNI